MKIYFYCSYENSMKGFSMTEFVDGALVPASDIPSDVLDFFSYDRFQVLWRDLCPLESIPRRKPPVSGGFLGIRGLCGRNSENRKFTVNLCMIAEKEENDLLRKIALTALGNYPLFESRTVSLLTVGGPCSYELNASRFSEWIKACSSASVLQPVNVIPSFKKLLPALSRSTPPKKDKDILRLAVYTSCRDDVTKLMRDSKSFRGNLENVIDTLTFSNTFISQAPLWEMKQ